MSSLTKPTPLDLKDYVSYLEPRKRDSHKGDFGHVLVVGGDIGYTGAVRLTGEAALRVGAGLVSIATHPAHASFLQAARPELMCHPITQPKDLLPLIKRATVIAIGPGLGQHPWGSALLDTVLQCCDLPLVLDADALNGIAVRHYEPHPNRIFTPHPGEAAKLLKIDMKQVQAHRLDAITQLTQQYQGIFVLKGRGTLIAEADKPAYICNAGNPGMSTAGMGDLLTGLIAGLVAQHIPLLDAACLGVLVHAHAGDLAAQKGERGLIASDLFSHIRTLVNPSGRSTMS